MNCEVALGFFVACEVDFKVFCWNLNVALTLVLTSTLALVSALTLTLVSALALTLVLASTVALTLVTLRWP